MPFMPPPPICAARRLHDAGSSTRKLIGRAVGLVSTGAIVPSTRQCAGAPLAASTQDGVASVTLRTGAPMAAGGTGVPRRSAVQSADAIALPESDSAAFDAPAAPRWASAAPDVAIAVTRSATSVRIVAPTLPRREPRSGSNCRQHDPIARRQEKCSPSAFGPSTFTLEPATATCGYREGIASLRLSRAIDQPENAVDDRRPGTAWLQPRRQHLERLLSVQRVVGDVS